MAVQILDKSFLVLETLSREFSGLGISELAGRVDLNVSTVHRILNTLLQRGYVRQEDDKRYSLSQKFVDLSCSYLGGLDLKELAAPFLRQMSRDLKTTVFLATTMDNQAVYIDRYDDQNKLRCYTTIGERRPLYCTALGKSLLQGFGSNALRAYIESCDFRKITSTTLASGDQLLEELREGAARGWSMDNEEAVEGVICFAAPIHDYRGQVIAAVSTSMNRESPDIREGIVETLVSVSRKISGKMGYRGEGRQRMRVIEP